MQHSTNICTLWTKINIDKPLISHFPSALLTWVYNSYRFPMPTWPSHYDQRVSASRTLSSAMEDRTYGIIEMLSLQGQQNVQAATFKKNGSSWNITGKQEWKRMDKKASKMCTDSSIKAARWPPRQQMLFEASHQRHLGEKSRGIEIGETYREGPMYNTHIKATLKWTYVFFVYSEGYLLHSRVISLYFGSCIIMYLSLCIYTWVNMPYSTQEHTGLCSC